MAAWRVWGSAAGAVPVAPCAVPCPGWLYPRPKCNLPRSDPNLLYLFISVRFKVIAHLRRGGGRRRRPEAQRDRDGASREAIEILECGRVVGGRSTSGETQAHASDDREETPRGLHAPQGHSHAHGQSQRHGRPSRTGPARSCTCCSRRDTTRSAFFISQKRQCRPLNMALASLVTKEVRSVLEMRKASSTRSRLISFCLCV